MFLITWYTDYSATLYKMEVTAIIGLALFLASELIPYLPIAGNGVVEAIINALRQVFPKPEK